MEIKFNLSFSEAIDRVTEALWNDGQLSTALRSALPQLEALAKSHYMDVAKNTRPLRSGDPGVGIESFAMFEDLTEPIIKDDRIIFDTSLDYAMEQEDRLRSEYGKSFLPDRDQILEIVQAAIRSQFG